LENHRRDKVRYGVKERDKCQAYKRQVIPQYASSARFMYIDQQLIHYLHLETRLS
jgi:hypothetical protein